MTTTAHLLSIGRRRPGEVWTRQGRRFCCITSLMLVTTVGQSRRGTLTWPLRSRCDKHHARTETRGTQGDRRTTLWPTRLACWLTHLADRADLGDNVNPPYYRGGALGRVICSTRITVTLSVFIFSACFLVQNCRELRGATF
jgi:hypothetical protein